MKYLMIIAILFWINGCGESNSNEKNTKPPASPHTNDSGKTPPSVPVID